MFHFADLRDQLAQYLTQEQVEQISQAYLLAAKAHEGQTRSSGDPYIIHPVEVARILANMRMDYESIMAAMLHDVIEDTSVDKEEIASKFGNKVAELVDGVSKLAQIKFESKVEAQASNLRKMMLAMSNDIRVIIVKLADRMHNMRTLDALKREKQRRIALETLEIYAPISHRLGMNKFRTEFEDLGFSYLYPMRHKILNETVRKARGNRKKLIENIENKIEHRLEQENVNLAKIVGREKHLYSLYKKMRDKDLSLSEVMDIYAIRVIIPDVETCYKVLGIIHNLYNPVHGKFKDYIAVPKSNGYQSLHTTVLGPFGIPVEIQIRTEEMHHVAEDGIAAHWIYKSQHESISEAEIRARKWLQGLLDIQKGAGNSKEFIENLKVDLYPDEVYVFTPQGDIWSLPQGATAVDFAYTVHTDVGNSCIAVKIDRRLMPLSTRLKSGQTVEIITAENSNPNPAWLSFVTTGKARSNIRHWLKTQKLNELISLGKRLVERALSALSLTLDNVSNEQFEIVLKELNIATKDRLFEEVGMGNQIAAIIARRLVIDEPANKELSAAPLAIKGTEGMVLSYGKCCRPIPGDPVVGFLTTGRGIVIHRESCTSIPEVKKSPDKFIFVKWADTVEGSYKVELRIDVINKRGTLAIVANAISDCAANIENVRIDERDSRHNSLEFLLQIKDRAHLAEIIKNVRNLDLVTKVYRL